MKKAIVTGANGFVGSYLLKELSKQGIETIAVVKDDSSDVTNIKNICGVKIVYCAMEDLTSLPDKVTDNADTFFHLAWAGSTGAARADYNMQLTNVAWSLEAANVAKDIGCRRFIGAGTLAEYDVNAYSGLDGSKPNGVSCYGAAKLAAHYMSKAECNRLGIEHIWAYLSNIYGIGDYSSNFINFAVKTMLDVKPANFTSGEQMYDFVYVSDIAQGLYLIGKSGKNNYAYYIGSTKPRQLKAYIQEIRNAINCDIKLNLGAIPFNGVCQPASIFDCTKLVEDTGYKPEVLFEDGIRQTINWLKSVEEAQ